MAVIAGIIATVAVLGGCSPAGSSAPTHRTSLVSVEFDDQPMALPATRLVTCRRAAGEQSVFFWTGSNILMPRRPMEERRSDSVEVRFDDDAQTVTEAKFQFLQHGEEVSGRWSRAAGGHESSTLTSLGAGRYLLTATVRRPTSSQPTRLVFVRFEFDC